MKKLFEGKNPTVIGLYIGVILGCVVMMVTGGLGYTQIADKALISGVFLGVMGGGLVGYIQSRRQPAKKDEPDDPENGAAR